MTALRRTAVLLTSIVLALVTLGSGSSGLALGAATSRPEIQITTPADGSTTNDPTPVFSGKTSDAFAEEWPIEILRESEDVEVSVHALSEGEAQAQATVRAAPGPDGSWSVSLNAPLPDGSYRVLAVQHEGKAEATFTVDTVRPALTLSSPTNGGLVSAGSVVVAGSAGTAEGDRPAVTVQLYAGDRVGAEPPLETLGVSPASGAWSGTLGGVGPGTYTAQASQQDTAGNTGTSAPVTFTVLAPPPAPGPSASFTWIPAAPQVGETISLVSTATDLSSPLTGFAWALAPGAPFSDGKPVITTSFATAGDHVVRLRVSDAAGQSRVATETIHVSPQAKVAMVPFPVVRIAGRLTGAGARITLLTVQAPIGAHVIVRCRGRGCPTKTESRSATSSRKGKQKLGSVLLTFRRFARVYAAGATLEILVVKPGEIGKYTRFRIRRHKLPVREDACIVSSGAKPIPCVQRKS